VNLLTRVASSARFSRGTISAKSARFAIFVSSKHFFYVVPRTVSLLFGVLSLFFRKSGRPVGFGGGRTRESLPPWKPSRGSHRGSHRRSGGQGQQGGRTWGGEPCSERRAGAACRRLLRREHCKIAGIRYSHPYPKIAPSCMDSLDLASHQNDIAYSSHNVRFSQFQYTYQDTEGLRNV
jgi:hypothetical protein